MYKIATDKIKTPEAVCSLGVETGKITTNWNGTLNLKMKKAAPQDDILNEDEQHKVIRLQKQMYLNCNVEEDIIFYEIKMAIMKTKSNKASGFDGFKTEMIKALWSCSGMIVQLV